MAGAAILIGVELASPCPGGGPLAFGDCERVRPFTTGVVALAVALYLAGLTGVRQWSNGLLARRVADRRAARDWYLLAAAVGLLVAPLLSFTLVSALR